MDKASVGQKLKHTGVCSWMIFNGFTVPVKTSVLADISIALSGPAVEGQIRNYLIHKR